MDGPAKFRAVIVGGGMVGLTAAHIFSKVGIDFVILEKHKTVLASRGSDLAVWPQTMRIFDQLGVLETMNGLLDYCSDIQVITCKDGRKIRSDEMLSLVERNHGHPINFMSRPQMVNFLYDSLPQTAKDCILLEKQVTDVEISEDGVTVTCEDGTSHRGSIVVGADGVRSQVRLYSQALRAGCEPKELPQGIKTPFTTTYRMFFCNIPILPGLEPNSTYSGVHQGSSTQLINGSKAATLAVYEKLDTPTSTLKRYTQADSDDLLKRVDHLYVAPNLTLSEALQYRTNEPCLIDLEEGFIEDHWFHKRIVLVGDSVRKYEPHLGLGYNSGVSDVVVLANQLRTLLQKDECPGTLAIEKAFESYQEARMEQTKQMASLSEQGARLLAWLNWKHMVIGRYVLNVLSPLAGFIITKTISSVVSQAPVLDELQEKNLPQSRVSWKFHPSVGH
ncbi:hypothetical protein PFICI_11297 [Pestalotiopsis fici W106-1]|uniref:FAD-binding domain-containing protein n=1 Tax=Pestalotiopsis fici (strain W106-1 / CGMCC3.15140) TaxID=1229662 RepID=W3WU65_PESFW|nr:uncharacterized protein PFICI_11297 [Pestalotiopsis fici W106-1]ETS77423.1 hypothetical protein PFICI_11297 [Pestalotiopsis fici W106-1]